jgi:TolB-like protein/class 3 adenylate cyclase/Tfp pilus assembly protein PilF
VPIYPIERKLAAIFAADIAGYSRLMGRDEVGTLARLKAYRAIVDGLITSHRGRIFNTAGDSVVADFASAVDAVRCAVTMQAAIAKENAGASGDEPMQFRIGVHVGDVMVDGDNLLGDGVNIAARLEALAEPGSICISSVVHDQVGNKLPVGFDDLGEQKVKNIAQAIRVYRVQSESPSVRPVVAPPLPDKPSIAVLPFQNMSGDPEQEYFADGMVEEIITALSRVRWLFVIARNSSFTYKGHAVDIKRVGRELGVRYVLEGSVRKGGHQIRITGQLIDAGNGTHLWADRFDGTLEDVFELQDQVTASVVGAIAPRVEQAEIYRAKHKPTDNLDAYDNYLRGVASLHAVFNGTKEAVSEALQRFYRAIDLDPEFASAFGMAAWCYALSENYGWSSKSAEETAELERLARQAARLAKEDAVALYSGGFALTRVAGQLEAATALIDRALALDPNLAAAWHLSGWVKLYSGEPEAAIKHLAHAMRLNPLDPMFFGMQNGTAAAHFLAGRYDAAASWAEMALSRHGNRVPPSLRLAAASHALSGRIAEAQRYMAVMRAIDPDLRLTNISEVAPFRRPEDVTRYADGLRKAGLPE